MMNGNRESDSVVVSAKSLNKEGEIPLAEEVEKRTLTKGNSQKQSRGRAQNRETLTHALERIRQAAKRDKAAKFTSLMHHIAHPMMLTEAYLSLKRDASPGIDGVTWREYGQGLKGNLESLSERLHTGAYRAQPVKRVYIPKPDGEERPLGVPCLEDKIVQKAAVMVLNEIYEADFLGFSYGFRPGRSPHGALDAVYTGILTKRVNFILDADIQGFFDNLDRGVLMGTLQQRIADPRVLRLVGKWLKAGILEDGRWRDEERGTPQGGSASPLLANVFLHYVFDLWVHSWRQTEASANVIVVRFADDIVLGFERKSDANRCHKLLQARFDEHGLKLHPCKTRLVEFGPYARSNAKKKGKGKPETFNFLGFTHICGVKYGNGMFTVYRRTISKRKRAKLKEVREELRRRMHHKNPEVGAYLAQVLNGHYRYYGVPGNWQSLYSFRQQILWSWKRTLTRRSQTTWVTWERMRRLSEKYLPPIAIFHPYPLERMGVTTQSRSRMR